MGRIAEFLNTMKPTNEADKKDVPSVLTALNSSSSMGGKYPIGNAELTAKVKSLEAAGLIEYDKHYDKWKKGSGKKKEEDADQEANPPGGSESKTAGFIKELINTSWSGSNDEQMKAVELLKGLATSDEPEANAFMKKIDDFMSGMKDDSAAQEAYKVSEEYEEEVKKLRAEREKLMKLQHDTREKVGGGITHPEVAKVYVKICDVDLALHKLHLKDAEEKLAAAKKRKDRSAIQSHQNSIDYLKKKIKEDEDSKKEHEADISKKK